MKQIFLGVMAVVLFTSLGYCQDAQELLENVSKVYVSSEVLGDSVALGGNAAEGFSLSVLIAGILFGCVGFSAFVYGKNNSYFRPMIIGFILMGFPYFVKNIIALYFVGIILTVILFVWRE